MEWAYMLMPISGVEMFWPGLVIMGLGVGIVGGFVGMGAAWVVTPGLNILGFPMAFAIGTDMAHIAGKSLVSTIRHGKFGNVDYPLGFAMLAGTIVGIEIGAQLIMWFEQIGKVDLYVRILYMGFLFMMAWWIYEDRRKRKQKEIAAEAKGEKLDKLAGGIEWYKTVHKLKIPPMMHFKVANIHVSWIVPIGVGLITGFIAGVLGIGGGLVRMPGLIYFVGCPTHIAVGTDLFEVMLSGLYGAITYTYKGRTELIAVIIMLVGAAAGAQVGAVATKYYKGMGIRFIYGCCVFIAATSVGQKLIARMYDIPWLDTFSAVWILGGVGFMMLVIMRRFFQGAAQEVRLKREAKAAAKAAKK